MKQFRSQRNFYIAGFALFLWLYVANVWFNFDKYINKFIFSVIKRLINLLSDVAREMSESEAARKQAEGAHRHIEGLMSKDPAVRFDFYLINLKINFFRKLIHEKFLFHQVMHHVILIQKYMMLKLKN